MLDMFTTTRVCSFPDRGVQMANTAKLAPITMSQRKKGVLNASQSSLSIIQG